MGRFTDIIESSDRPEPAEPILRASPDEFAENAEIASSLGTDVETVSRNKPQAKAEYAWKNVDFAKLNEETPAVGKLLSTPGTGEMMHDDIDSLSMVEKSLAQIGRVGKNIGGAAKASLFSFNQGALGALQAAAETLQEDPVVSGLSTIVTQDAPFMRAASFFGQKRKEAEALAAWSRPDPAQLSEFERGVYSGVESLARQAPAIGASILLKNPAPMVISGSVTEGGSSYGAARDKGLGVWQSVDYGTAQGLVEYLTEQIPAARLVRDTGLKTGFMRTIINQLSAEIPGEQIATLLQDLNEWMVLNPEKPFSAYVNERPSAAAQTLVATIVATGGQVSIAKTAEAAFNSVGEGAKQSKLHKRSAKAFEDAVESMGAESVYVDSDAFRTYFQSQNMDPEQVAKELGVTSYSQSVATGEMIEIPAKKYAAYIAPTNHNQFFSREIRLSPEIMNARESDEYIQNVSSERQAETTEDPILADISSQLEAVGFDKQTAADYASQTAAYFNTQAQRYGVEPTELYGRYALKVTNQELAQEGALYNQSVLPAEMTEDQYIAAINPSGKRLAASERPTIYAGDIEGAMPDSAELVAGDAKAKDGRPIQIYMDAATGAVWAKVDGVEAGYMTPMSDTETDLSVAQEFQGLGIGGLLSFQYRKENPLAQSGGLTDAGEAAARSAFRKMQGATYSQSATPQTETTTAQAAETGKPMAVYFARNTASSKGNAPVGMDFGQQIEPAGEYMVIQEADMSEQGGDGWEYGFITFSNPLVLEHKNTTSSGWKKDLSEMFGGKTGKALTAAVRKAGYDGIVTRDKYGYSESVNLAGKKAGSTTLNQKDRGQIAASQTETPAFREWFGDSKVVDADGKPLVVYHGTASDFIKFKTHEGAGGELGAGAYFTSNKSFASSYAEGTEVWDTRDGAMVLPVFLSIRNPFDATGIDALPSRRSLIAKGFDGVIDRSASGGEAQYVAFRPAQIKSAIGNRGTFDPNDQNILHQKDRGQIAIGPDGKLNISLLKDMDLSTFLHESGHAYLEVMRDMVRDLKSKEGDLTDTQQQILADAETLTKWLGVASLDDIQVDQHEKFARGFELYTAEGNAPSVALRKAFARFRAWMLAVYRTLRNLNVQINDDVRGVFDRMLATDEEIEAARKEGFLDPVFATAELAGMTDAEFKNYRKTIEAANLTEREKLEQKILKEKFREKEKWWKEELANTTAEVEAELSAEKRYIAADLLRKGETAEGDPFPKLDRKEIKAVYPKETASKLNRYSVAKGEAIGLDAAADLLGYSSGDELANMLAALPDKKVAAQQEAAARMRAKHGDLMADASQFADEAKAAVLSDHRIAILEAELKALNKLRTTAAPMVKTEGAQNAAKAAEGRRMMQAIPPVYAMRDAAKGRIAQMRVRDVKPQTFLVAARKASKASFEAAGKQEYQLAATEKQKEILNIELFREASRVREQNDKRVEFLRSFDKPKVRERIAKTGYLEPIDSILERFSFKRSTLKAIDRRKSLRDYIEKAQEEGLPVELDPQVMDESFAVAYQDLTNEQLEGIYDSVKLLANLHKLKQRLLKVQDKRQFDEYAEAVSQSIYENHKGKITEYELESSLPYKRLGAAFRSYYAMHRKVPSYARVMDGQKDGGLAWESFVRPFNDAADQEAVMREQAAIRLNEIFRPFLNLQDRVDTKINKATFGLVNKGLYRLEHYDYLKTSKFPSGNLSHAGKLMVALNWGTATNRQRVLDGFGWTEPAVNRLLGTLTEKDWKFVQDVWGQINSYWPQSKEMSERVNGVAPEKIEGVRVNTRFGDFPGAYFPIHYDPVNSQKSFFRAAVDVAKQAMDGATVRSTTKHGFREKRVEVVKGQPLSLDMGVIYNHINDIIHDLTHFEALIDANRLLKDSRIKGAIDQTAGAEAYQQFQSYLKDVATGDNDHRSTFERGMLWLRAGVSVASMGLNLTTAAIQFTGASQSIVRIGPTWFYRGLSEWAKNPVKAIDTVQEKSSFMRLRSKTQLREINEIRNQVEGGSGGLTNAYFWMIAKMQMAVDMPTWLGQYQKSLADGETDAKAIAIADQAVKDSQGGGQVQDLAAIQRGAPLVKLFTAFYTYFNTTLNLTAESINRTDFTKPRDVGLMAVDMLMLYTVPTILGTLIRDALKGGDDDEPLEERLVREQLAYMLGTFVGLRELSSSVTGFYGYEGPAGARFFAEVNKLSKQAQQGDGDAAFWKAFNNSAGILLHYPSGQVQKTVEGLIAIQEDKTDNPKAILFGPPKD